MRRFDLREGLEAAFDLTERHPLAVDLDQVVLAPRDRDPPGFVLLAEVARSKPPVGREATDGDAVFALREVNLRDRRTDSAAERGPDGPVSLPRELFGLRLATRSSTPSKDRPTLSESRPARSIASGPACVLW